jgi:death-on-curing protein
MFCYFNNPEQLLFLHARLVDKTGGSHGVRDLNMLLSALGRPQASYDLRDLYPIIYTKAAALMDSLIRNHPFLNGKERTGITAAAMFLRMNGYQLSGTNIELEEFALGVAQSKHHIEEMAGWFRMYTQSMDNSSESGGSRGILVSLIEKTADP